MRIYQRLNPRHIIPDAIVIVASCYASLWLRVGGTPEFWPYIKVLNRSIPIFLAIRLITFAVLRVYDIIWRYVSLKDAARLFRAILLSSVLVVAATYLVDVGRIPRATFFIDTLLVSLALSGIRVGRRFIYDYFSKGPYRIEGRLTLIIGAGTNGRNLAQRIDTDRALGMKLLGFLDDNPEKVGRTIAGVKVLGTHWDLGNVLTKYPVQELIIAISQLSGETLRSIVQVAQRSGIRPQLMAQLQNRATENKAVRLVADIELSDLLNRPSRPIETQALNSLVQNRTVLVTGAGGSIGSEICRQVLSAGPKRLLLLDHSEYNLYAIDKQLRVSATDTNFVVPILTDIKNRATLRAIYDQYSPEIVLHAAAYKHVHLVECNPFSAILNNVQGTRNLLELSDEFGVGTFVLISTDKAVNPVGIMGATKRVCEMLVAEAGLRTEKRYCAVRFGNVLGSSGSLIPLLQAQIQSGSPVTITHPDMTRYFMLIPEAVSLVLKAALHALPGDIMILRMGEPVKIVDIAHSLIALSGQSEEKIPIVYTGMRPGEKMFEELYFSGNEVNTSDPDILLLTKEDALLPFREDHALAMVEWIDRIIVDAQAGLQRAVKDLYALINSQPIQKQTTGTPYTLDKLSLSTSAFSETPEITH